MKKMPDIHIPSNNIKSNNQKTFYSANIKKHDEKNVLDEKGVKPTTISSVNNNVLLAKKIDYLMKNPHMAKNVRIKTNSDVIRTNIISKNEEVLQTKNGDIKLNDIINIYLN